jgi:hypothetical protein
LYRIFIIKDMGHKYSMIDFSKIHSFNHGQRYSFEELVCQLARREVFTEHSVFKRIEGAGGDGGVEAYWKKPNGKKTGYQAKYFLRSGDIDWKQLDKSVTQALAVHPELECYVVALPCDLTDRAGKKRHGQTGWEHWDAHIKKWKKEAAAAGIKKIKFQPWSKSEIIARLANSNSEGLREFFFGDVELSIEWFRDKIEEAILALDERFHPEDHVDVRIEKLFSVISRAPSYREELLSTLYAIGKCGLPDKRLLRLQQNPGKQITDELQKTFIDLLGIDDQISLDPQHEWDSASWSNLADKLLSANGKILQWYLNYDRSLGKESHEKSDLRQLIRKSRKLDDAVDQLNRLIRLRYMDAEKKGFTFIRGSAGSGKSHLLAKCAENAIGHEQPAILLLGQRLNNSDLWTQISQILGLPGRSADQILGALDAAGKLVGTRTLLLIDAINEGEGSNYWRNQIASLIHKLKGFSHLCCIISCRSEYFELAVPQAIAKKYPVFDIRGFETPEEQLNAARVYLDRRGIARPSTPWLSPEFVNPLFLRSVCLSLEREKKSEFPSGLTGTRKILKFYLDSIGRNITEKEGSTVPLAPKLGRAVQDIAGKMLERKKDFLELDICRDEIAAHFRNIHPQTASDWLSVFLNNGLLRKDPNSSSDDFADEDVVRFSFQRFQDFLMAEKSLNEVKTVDGLFDERGPLGFCIQRDHFTWEWRGLMDALAVALPEKLQTELVDALPGGAEKWWADWSIHEIFAESVKWRARSAFTERSLELLNDFRYRNPEPLELLLQIAVSADHPWNAELLHKNLWRRRLPDRDAFWTTWVNAQTDDVDSSVGVLIEWCRTGQAPHTKPENQLLAALVLSWFFTSTNRAIRDKSTKALANILLTSEDIFPNLLNRFVGVDDLYILERLLAAAYASCCLRPEPNRLSKYSEAIFENIFKNCNPPFGILLRDYAFGIIELASYYSALPSTVNFGLCKPPYKSSKLRLSVSEEKLNEIAKRAGGNEIIHSAANPMGDFASYEIGPHVGYFLRVPLAKDVPLSDEQKARLFENEVVGYDRKRIQAFERLQNTANPYAYGLLSPSFGTRLKKPTQKQIDKWKEELALAEASFLRLLSDDEIRRFLSDAASYLYKREHGSLEERKFDLNAMQRWVAKRAYDYGWTRKRFENDSSQMGRNYRDRPSVERIGKKYQWLALDELLSRLADNYWMEGEYGSLPKTYGNPLDISFKRDIDPTIIEEKASHEPVSQTHNSWVSCPWIILDQVEEDRLASWPFEKDPAVNLKILPFRIDADGVKWLVLYEHQSKTEKYDGDRVGEHGFRMQEFRFLATIMVKKTNAKEIAEKFKEKEKIDIWHWAISEITDAAFHHEAPWRDTWSQEKWIFDNWKLPTGVGYAQMAARYVWESHLDAALPDGYSSHLPSIWLAHELNLYADLTTAGVWRDQNDEIVFSEFKGEGGETICLLRMDKLDEIVGGDCTFLTFLIAEKNAWPGGSSLNASWRRVEGVCWRDGRGMNALTWSRDVHKDKSA